MQLNLGITEVERVIAYWARDCNYQSLCSSKAVWSGTLAIKIVSELVLVDSLETNPQSEEMK